MKVENLLVFISSTANINLIFAFLGKKRCNQSTLHINNVYLHFGALVA